MMFDEALMYLNTPRANMGINQLKPLSDSSLVSDFPRLSTFEYDEEEVDGNGVGSEGTGRLCRVDRAILLTINSLSEKALFFECVLVSK